MAVSDVMPTENSVPPHMGAFSPINADVLTQIQKQYWTEGFVIIRDVLDPGLIEGLVTGIDKQLVPYRGDLPRHLGVDTPLQPNRFTDDGLILNSVMNPHALDVPALAEFTAAFWRLVSSAELGRCLLSLAGQLDYQIFQGILFFVCLRTEAHIDSFSGDMWPRGGACTLWIPLEDVGDSSGPPFVFSYKQLSDLAMEFGVDSDVWDHANPNYLASCRYADELKRLIAARDLKPTPILAGPGDVVIWNSLTVHGSMPAPSPVRSRRSIQVLVRPSAGDPGSYRCSQDEWPEMVRRRAEIRNNPEKISV